MTVRSLSLVALSFGLLVAASSMAACVSIPTSAEPGIDAANSNSDAGLDAAVQFDGGPDAQSCVPCDGGCESKCETEFASAGMHTYQADLGCTYFRMHVWGAGGGDGENNFGAAAGGYAMVELVALEQQDFTVMVGAPGESTTTNNGAAGGEPGGGGPGGDGNNDTGGGGGGGGYSGVFLGSEEPSQDDAIVIAGAGGGSGGGGGDDGQTEAGAGGGVMGENGGANSLGGTQVLGIGSAALVGGAGKNGKSGSEDDGGGGGGGGYYGGVGGKDKSSDGGGGGGGSGYVNCPSPCLLERGNRKVPGNKDSQLRDSAGEPHTAGKVVIICLPAP